MKLLLKSFGYCFVVETKTLKKSMHMQMYCVVSLYKAFDYIADYQDRKLMYWERDY